MRYSLYKWVVMPMGLMNAPTTLMHTMHNLCSGILEFVVAMFLDNILIYSYLVKEHFTLLEMVLLHLCQYMSYCKLKKYSFLQKSTMLLGFEVTPEGMGIND